MAGQRPLRERLPAKDILQYIADLDHTVAIWPLDHDNLVLRSPNKTEIVVDEYMELDPLVNTLSEPPLSGLIEFFLLDIL